MRTLFQGTFTQIRLSYRDDPDFNILNLSSYSNTLHILSDQERKNSLSILWVPINILLVPFVSGNSGRNQNIKSGQTECQGFNSLAEDEIAEPLNDFPKVVWVADILEQKFIDDCVVMQWGTFII